MPQYLCIWCTFHVTCCPLLLTCLLLAHSSDLSVTTSFSRTHFWYSLISWRISEYFLAILKSILYVATSLILEITLEVPSCDYKSNRQNVGNVGSCFHFCFQENVGLWENHFFSLDHLLLCLRNKVFCRVIPVLFKLGSLETKSFKDMTQAWDSRRTKIAVLESFI